MTNKAWFFSLLHYTHCVLNVLALYFPFQNETTTLSRAHALTTSVRRCDRLPSLLRVQKEDETALSGLLALLTSACKNRKRDGTQGLRKTRSIFIHGRPFFAGKCLHARLKSAPRRDMSEEAGSDWWLIVRHPAHRYNYRRWRKDGNAAFGAQKKKQIRVHATALEIRIVFFLLLFLMGMTCYIIAHMRIFNNTGQDFFFWIMDARKKFVCRFRIHISFHKALWAPLSCTLSIIPYTPSK